MLSTVLSSFLILLGSILSNIFLLFVWSLMGELFFGRVTWNNFILFIAFGTSAVIMLDSTARLIIKRCSK